MQADIVSSGDSAPPYAFSASAGLAAFLHERTFALAISTYQIGKLFLVGAVTADRLSVTERTFNRCLGIAAGGGALHLAGLHAILRFQNVVPRGQELQGHDAVFVPQVSWFTGDVFAHDLGIARDGRPLFVNTMFSCLAAVDETTSFRPVWRPPFISNLAPGDRCHLNGLAMHDGVPRSVTLAARTDTPGGWREQRREGGCVMDVASSEVVVAGLSMPHSPRWHDGNLYLCNAGSGELGLVDAVAGRFVPIAFCPGFARGLAIHDGYAFVGLSLPRQNNVFAGLPIEERLLAEKRPAECVVQVIDLASGALVHWLRVGGAVRELYDVACLPGLRTPMVVGFAQDQINRLITVGQPLRLDAAVA